MQCQCIITNVINNTSLLYIYQCSRFDRHCFENFAHSLGHLRSDPQCLSTGKTSNGQTQSNDYEAGLKVINTDQITLRQSRKSSFDYLPCFLNAFEKTQDRKFLFKINEEKRNAIFV